MDTETHTWRQRDGDRENDTKTETETEMPREAETARKRARERNGTRQMDCQRYSERQTARRDRKIQRHKGEKNKRLRQTQGLPEWGRLRKAP